MANISQSGRRIPGEPLMPKGTLYIFCGKMASGKSTLAKKIAEQSSLPLISEDVLLGTLYPGRIVDIPSYVRHSEKVKLAIAPILVDLLGSGASVVLDFPANTVDQRNWMRNIVEQAGSHYQFHYLDTSDATCKAQLKARAVREPERHATDTSELFDAITSYFEPPSMDEGFEIIRHAST